MLKIEQVLAPTLKDIPPSESLGFGQYFTDHMFVAKYKEGQGWYSNQILPFGPLSLEPGASALQYGQSLFEGMKAFKHASGEVVLFRPEFNFRRLCEGAKALCMQPPTSEVFLKGIAQLIKTDERWIPTAKDTSLYIRPTLIGSESFLGVRPSKEFLFYVFLSPVGNYYSKGLKPVSIWIEEKFLRAAPGGLGATKAGANYAASLNAAEIAKSKGYEQVLWLDVERKNIEEVGTMNVFFVFKDEIATPMLNGSILAGGMRDSVISLLRHQNKKVVERKISMTEITEKIKNDELLEAFGTGTAAVISPIGEFFYQEKNWVINKKEIGSLSQNLRDTMTGISQGKIPDQLHWLQTIDSLLK